MKKTLTAALALSTFAGLALATSTIETQKAGYIDVSTNASVFVTNPFAPFEGSTLTLADFDGNQVPNDKLRVYSDKGKKLFDAKWHEGAWYVYDGGNYLYSTNTYELERGESVMFVGSSNGDVLTLAGTLNTNQCVVTCVQGQNYVGNVVPVDKTLGDFSVGGTFDPWSDRVVIKGTDYVYDSSDRKWYLRKDYIAPGDLSGKEKNSLPIVKGEGFRVYAPSHAGVTITLPGI